MNPQKFAVFCTDLVERLVHESPENHLHLLDEKAWGAPLIGIAGGDDPLFNEYKQIIGAVQAITLKGHDKVACHNYIRSVTAPYSKQVCGRDVTPCGLCQARVPCERRNPLSSGSK